MGMKMGGFLHSSCTVCLTLGVHSSRTPSWEADELLLPNGVSGCNPYELAHVLAQRIEQCERYRARILGHSSGTWGCKCTRSTTPHFGCSQRTGRIEGSCTKVVAEHGQAARWWLAQRLVLDHIPVPDESPVPGVKNVTCHPVHRLN